MLIKVLIIVSIAVALIDCAKLLRTPKVYNAVITTDGNEIITPSKAYPLIQTVPVYTSSLYPTSFYNFQSNVKDVQPSNSETHTVEKMDSTSRPSKTYDTKTEKSPIDLNESGFPPSLIPIRKIPSYPYAQPFIFDSYGNLQTINQYPVLPPSYYPQQEHQLPAIEQPLFRVSDRRFENLQREDIEPNNSLPTNENLENRKIDSEIPPIPFSIEKAN